MTSWLWRDRWIAFRNRWLADPVFQRWATDFPLTRSTADRRARSLFDLVSGFVYSQALESVVRLGLLERLSEHPLTTAEISTRVALRPDALERLLKASTALELTQRVGASRWALGAQGAALLGNPGLTQMILHHTHLYADLADGVGLLARGEHATGALARFWPYANPGVAASDDAGDSRAYSALMAATQPTVATDVLDAYPFTRHQRLLDVGGGLGGFVSFAAERAPDLDLMLFDLPGVIGQARERLAAENLLDRTRLFEGDFLSDPLPAGADLITLIRILHDHDDAAVARILRGVREALPKHGRLLIAEPMSDSPRADRVADVYFAFYLLAMGRGRARTPAELSTMLRTAGFSRVRRLRTRTPFLLRAIVAHP